MSYTSPPKSKPFIDLHKKYSALAESEKNYTDKLFVQPAKFERKLIPELMKKEETVEELVANKSNQKKGLKKPFRPPLLLKIKSKPSISSNTRDDDEPPVKVIKKRRGRPPSKKSKETACSKIEECTDSILESEIIDSEKKSTCSVRKTLSRKKNLPQNPHVKFSALCSPCPISSDVDCSPPHISKVSESPPKLDLEGIKVQDKNKIDTLRKLFGTRSKGSRWGKGKITIINNTKAMLNDKKPIISSESDISLKPNEPDGRKTSKLSIMCKIPLTMLPPKLKYLLQSERSEEPRPLTDLAHTKQVKKKQKHAHHKYHHKVSPSQIASGSDQSKSNKSPANTDPPTQLLFQQLSSDDYSNRNLDNVGVWQKPTSVDAGIPEAKIKPSSKSLKHR